MPPISELVDTCDGSTLNPQWVADGDGGLTGAGRMQVPAEHVAQAPRYQSIRSAEGVTWTGSALLVDLVAFPAGPANGQVWVMDPAPADTVARLGFEYRAAANALDLIGQAGPTYAPIGATTTLTYSPTTHRWLRVTHTGTAVVWATSPDGLTWTTRRTLAGPPAWTTKTTLLASFEAFRFDGTNDAMLLDSINLPPTRIVPALRARTAVPRAATL